MNKAGEDACQLNVYSTLQSMIICDSGCFLVVQKSICNLHKSFTSDALLRGEVFGYQCC